MLLAVSVLQVVGWGAVGDMGFWCFLHVVSLKGLGPKVSEGEMEPAAMKMLS